MNYAPMNSIIAHPPPPPPRDTPGNLQAIFARGAEIVVGSFFPGAGNCIPPGHYARVCVCCRLKV